MFVLRASARKLLDFPLSRSHNSHSSGLSLGRGSSLVSMGKTHCQGHQDPSKSVPILLRGTEANYKMVPINRVPITAVGFMLLTIVLDHPWNSGLGAQASGLCQRTGRSRERECV